MKSTGGYLKMQILDDQSLTKISEEPGTLATLRLPRQNCRRHLRVELGGTKRCGAGHGRVAARTDPKVDGTHHQGILQFFNLSININK